MTVPRATVAEASGPRPGRWRDFRGVLRPTGALVAGLGVAQLLCALLGGAVELWSFGRAEAPYDAATFGAIGLATSSFGLMLRAGGRRLQSDRLTRREAVLSVVLIWLMSSLSGAIPFAVLAEVTPLDAYFETVSALTTTGVTVITDVETRLSPTLLLWRSVLSWLGGMGIVVLFVAVFPMVGVGGKQMFKGEGAGTSPEGLKPRIAKTSFLLWQIYTALTVLCAALLVACGIDPFDAICHALTTMSTCGFSTRDGSIFEIMIPGVEYVVSAFMVLGSLNFALFFPALKQGSLKPILRSAELRMFFAMLAVATVSTTVATLPLYDHELEHAFRAALFQITSCMSSTGYFLESSGAYPPAVLAMLLGLIAVGGCAGSTAGGIKVERVVILAKLSGATIRRAYRPTLVRAVRMGRAPVSPAVLTGVASFFALFAAVLAVGTGLVASIEEVDVPAAFGATLACLAASGPAPWLSPDLGGDFAAFTGPGKLLLSLVMLFGRLELFTIFALFVPDFWRR